MLLPSFMRHPYVNGMTYEEEVSQMNRRAVSSRWDPQVRHDVAMGRIEQAIDKALSHPYCRFTQADLRRVAEMMGLRAHTDDTPSSATNGETSIRPSVSNGARAIDPAKRYRLKSTGEVVSGAELLRRRESDGSPK